MQEEVKLSDSGLVSRVNDLCELIEGLPVISGCIEDLKSIAANISSSESIENDKMKENKLLELTKFNSIFNKVVTGVEYSSDDIAEKVLAVVEAIDYEVGSLSESRKHIERIDSGEETTIENIEFLINNNERKEASLRTAYRTGMLKLDSYIDVYQTLRTHQSDYIKAYCASCREDYLEEEKKQVAAIIHGVFNEKEYQCAGDFYIDFYMDLAEGENSIIKKNLEARGFFIEARQANSNTKIYIIQNHEGPIATLRLANTGCIAENREINEAAVAKITHLGFIGEPSIKITVDAEEGEYEFAFVEVNDYFKNKSLFQMREKIDSANQTEIFDFVDKSSLQIIDVIERCNEVGVFMADVKPGNFLVSDNGDLVIQDTKSFRRFEDCEKNKDIVNEGIASLGYYPPEMNEFKGDFDRDYFQAYNLAACIYTSLTGDEPTEGIDLSREIFKTEQGAFYANLIEDLISKEPGCTVDQARERLNEHMKPLEMAHGNSFSVKV